MSTLRSVWVNSVFLPLRLRLCFVSFENDDLDRRSVVPALSIKGFLVLETLKTTLKKGVYEYVERESRISFGDSEIPTEQEVMLSCRGGRVVFLDIHFHTF